MSKALGGKELGGDMAYGAMDLTMSAYGVGRMVLKPDAWRLFRYVKTDYINAYNASGKGALLIEGINTILTGRSMYMDIKNNE